MFVRRVIIADEVQIESVRRVAVDDAQETQEFLMPMPVHAFADDLAPMTLPLATSSAANRVVVPCRL